MLFNGVDLNVYEIEEVYILATSEEAALEFYAEYENVHLEDIIAEKRDLENDGIHLDCDLRTINKIVINLKEDKEIRIIKMDGIYYVFTAFKDFILESMDKDWFKKIEKQPCIIAWNE